MRASKLATLLKSAFKHRRKVLIKGEPGIGKSDIVEQACGETYDLILSHPAVSDPTDYKGMPAVIQRPGEMTVAEFLPFGDLNRLIKAARPTVCFIDDLGQAAPAVQAALMQLLLARRVNGHKISDHVVFCGATNDTTHMAGVSGLLEPVKSRWDTIVQLDCDVEDWCDWALQHDVPPELVAFIRFRPNLLSEFKATRELKNSPSPRTVTAVGRWLQQGVTDFEVIAGAAGQGFATELTAFLKMFAELPSLDAILLDPEGAPVPQNPGACFAVATGLASKSTESNFERVVRYMKRLEKEYEVCCITDIMKTKPKLQRTPTFIKWATQNGKIVS